jgi:hypothetical protein
MKAGQGASLRTAIHGIPRTPEIRRGDNSLDTCLARIATTHMSAGSERCAIRHTFMDMRSWLRSWLAARWLDA